MVEEQRTFSHVEVVEIAENAANKAVANLFDKLDIDVSNKDAMRTLRDNLSFLEDQRQGAVILKQQLKKSALYLAGTAALGLVYLTWDAFKLGLLTWLQNVR